MTMIDEETTGHDAGSAVGARLDEGHGPQGKMGHSHGGHLLHMVPMVLILFAPRLGWPLTVGLLAVFGAYVYLAWRRRRGAMMASGKAPVRGPEE